MRQPQQTTRPTLTRLRTDKFPKPRLQVLAGFTALAIGMSGCLNFERFRHEKYVCNSHDLDIAEIIIRRAKAGKTALISGFERDRDGLITSISDTDAVIKVDGLILMIDRAAGSISALRGKRYYKLFCKQTIFTI